MPDVLYFIWALLPLVLLWSVLRAAGKKVVKTGGRESPAFYSKQLAFSVVMLAVAILIDKQFFEELAPTLSDIGIEPRIVRWLIYPAIMTIAAVIQQKITDKRNAEGEAEKKARRMKYAPKQ